MDCFTLFSPAAIPFEEGVEAPKRLRRAPKAPTSTTRGFPVGVIRFPVQTRPLLIVSEHARGFWLASAEDSGYKNIARQLVSSQKLVLIRFEVSFGTGK